MATKKETTKFEEMSEIKKENDELKHVVAMHQEAMCMNRGEYAARALQGLLSNYAGSRSLASQDLVEVAVAYADSLIKELNRNV